MPHPSLPVSQSRIFLCCMVGVIALIYYGTVRECRVSLRYDPFSRLYPLLHS